MALCATGLKNRTTNAILANALTLHGPLKYSLHNFRVGIVGSFSEAPWPGPLESAYRRLRPP